MSRSRPRRLLLIGVEGVEWSQADHHAKSGLCPNLRDLARRGLRGPLGGAPRSFGPAAWASMVTGVQPEVHGVWMAEEAWAGGLRPTSRASWRVAPLWARLAAAGLATGSVASPASRPGASWPGVHFDDELVEASAHDAADWALPRLTAPGPAREAIRDRRIHPAEVTADMLRGLVPDIEHIDQTRDATLPILAVTMAEAATIQAAASWLIEAEAPAAVFVRQAWLGTVRSTFEGVKDPRWSRVIPGAWRFLDGLVGHLATVAGPDTLVLVVSPGWRGRPGALLASGPEVESGGAIAEAGILDVAPIVLAHFGLADRDLPGRVPPEMRMPADLAPAPTAAPDGEITPDGGLLAEVQAWGLPAAPGAPAAWRAQAFASLANMIFRRAPEEAARAARAALALNPTNVAALWVLGAVLALEGPADALPEVAEALRAAAPDRGWGALARAAYHVVREEVSLATPLLLEAEADADPEHLLMVASVWLAAGRTAAAARVFRAVLAADPANAPARVGLAIHVMESRDFMEAETLLAEAARQDPAAPAIYLQWARLCLLTARPAQALRMARLARRMGASEEQLRDLREAGVEID